MARGRTRSLLVRKLVDGQGGRSPDHVIVEEPLEIRLDGVRVATTMRTPGHDYELAVGLCHTDGLLAGAPVQQVRYCATGSAVDTKFNVVTVDTGGAAPAPTPRLGTTTSSCGWCGTDEIEAVAERLTPLADRVAFPAEVLAAAPERVRAWQELFDATGGVHAAAAFDVTGAVRAVREDIGRHNAVDKVLGAHARTHAPPFDDLVLVVSARASFEILQKAAMVGVPVVVAVGAPSSLAVGLAVESGITLVAFARGASFSAYAHPERLGE